MTVLQLIQPSNQSAIRRITADALQLRALEKSRRLHRQVSLICSLREVHHSQSRRRVSADLSGPFWLPSRRGHGRRRMITRNREKHHAT
jgi:hypothetical protein